MTTRDHRNEHPDCKAIWPWLPACNRYRLNVNLTAAATEDVRGMPESDRDHWLDFLRGWEGRSRWHLRSEYISYRENWREDDRHINVAEAAAMARDLGDKYLQGRTVEQAANDAWRLKVQRLALEVLYVYKIPLPAYVETDSRSRR